MSHWSTRCVTGHQKHFWRLFLCEIIFKFIILFVPFNFGIIWFDNSLVNFSDSCLKPIFEKKIVHDFLARGMHFLVQFRITDQNVDPRKRLRCILSNKFLIDSIVFFVGAASPVSNLAFALSFLAFIFAYEKAFRKTIKLYRKPLNYIF